MQDITKKHIQELGETGAGIEAEDVWEGSLLVSLHGVLFSTTDFQLY